MLAGVDLAGTTAVVTGGYSGIGLETTRALAGRGARVFVPVRSEQRAAAALADVDGTVETAVMDLADLASVRRFADDVADGVDHLDLLVANAGIMATPAGRVGPGWERQFGVNHLGHAALSLALLPRLRAAPAPRVVALSSIAHKRSGIRWDDLHFDRDPYDKWAAYGQSKTANALFALALAPRLADDGGLVHSVHPGGIFTPLQRDLSVEEQVALGWRGEDGEPSEVARQVFKTPAQGCATTLWAAATTATADRNGAYCEDADVALLATPDSPAHLHVAPHACDADDAERLWAVTEELLAAA